MALTRYEVQKRYRERHPDRVKQFKRNWYKKIKLAVIMHYSQGTLKCACCDESIFEFLTIDHIFGRGRKHREDIGRQGSKLYSWLIKNNFPDGFRVLCYNCNCSRGHLGYCPHEK